MAIERIKAAKGVAPMLELHASCGCGVQNDVGRRKAVAVDAEESRYATAFTGRTASVRTTYERETVSRG